MATKKVLKTPGSPLGGGKKPAPGPKASQTGVPKQEAKATGVSHSATEVPGNAKAGGKAPKPKAGK
ncbi:hypothetical protein PC9H_010392 [Pleurotus ostreatus]|uniref:Uncharacterized protein n=2 Tax=Pleurotus ostreatus TaxID=5322 RepID=A0A067NE83_PLEO1|nr:uncharacterized protein PC9H_010392 [Pleurotus ostreatus]KAF7422236.1 hypothetical protein PC9H_010392 [Pleurotus ostreatus]KAJ8691975.1 hypothetical protein PTI98_011490 [Pleurotus ostreatus]KDQ26169.1 hypothetical protein PLEOSDRAFT_1090236 [Pleurotus ostreatus PC15]